jgi:putative Mn2+ efflux pump MntP
MGSIEVILIAVGLAMDAFAVSLAAGSLESVRGGRATFRLSFHFGLFQFLMPVVGWYAGTTVVRFIESVDHWIAFGLLAYVGVRMIRSGMDSAAPSFRGDPSRGATLVILSLATSIDAMAVGLSLAMIQVSVWYPSVVIGTVTAALSLVGVRAGNRLGERFGKHMAIVGGVILIVIGVRILLSHLLA